MTVDRLNAGDQVREMLRLARDLCMGISAFYVDPSGWVTVEPASSSTNGTLTDRAKELARSTLDHADARGDAPFWSAEPTIAGQMPDESLACVVVPLHHGDEFLGLIGVIDDWLPDLDDEQLLGLSKIADDLAGQLVARRQAEATVGGGAPEPNHPEMASEPQGRPTPPEGAFPHPATAGAPGHERDEAQAGPEERIFEPAGVGTASGEPPSHYEDFVGEITDNLPEAVLVARDDGTVIFANQESSRLTGLPRDEVLGAELTTPLDSLGVADASSAVASVLGAGEPELTLTGAHHRSFLLSTSRITTPLTGEVRIVVLRETPQATVQTDTYLESLLDALQEGIVLCNDRGEVIQANAEGHRLSGLAHDAQLVGRPYVTQTRLRNAEGALFTPEEHPVLRALRGSEVPAERVVVDDAHGERYHVVVSARPFGLEETTGALLTLRDVTLELREEARLNHLALHDALTGVANRYLLDEHLRRVLRTAKARGGLTALVFLDLDNFKTVNDRYGHDAGDEVLAAVASRVQNTVRSTELVARLGGDEFVVVCSKVAGPGDVEIVVERLRKTLAAPYQVAGHAVGVTASIGWVLADRHVETPETLLARADAQMYRSKRSRPRPSAVQA